MRKALGLLYLASAFSLESEIPSGQYFSTPKYTRVGRKYIKSELTPKQKKNRVKTKAQKQARKKQRK